MDLDPRFTFDSFVVGPANRLAVAAARRVADAPGSSYNPLFIYSASGLGKTHLLGAIGRQVNRLHGLEVLYETLEHLMEDISAAVEAGEQDVFRSRLGDAAVLLLDDVQFLAGHRQTQEELILAWDAVTSGDRQVVLSSDRPPQDIDGIDDRLLDRLSGGLIVDMGMPDYETRIAIARRKSDERGQRLEPEVYTALARVAFTNVRELQGALNRLLAVQELEERVVSADEIAEILGVAYAERGQDEFGAFLSDIAGTVGSVVEEADRTIADAILAWEGEGYRTRRLDGALTGTSTAAQAAEIVLRFEQDVARLRAIEAEIRSLDAGARELGSDALRDPDRLVDAQDLLSAVRERQAPPPEPPSGVTFDAVTGDSLAVRAARAVAAAPGDSYNPLYLLGPEGCGKSTLLAAIGNEIGGGRGLLVGYVDASAFQAELIDALERNRLDAWRARYRRADVLLMDDVDALAGTERAQEELFHLFDELHRSGRQLVFAGRAAPQSLPLPPRLRSRLESGLVVELEPAGAGGRATSRKTTRAGAAKAAGAKAAGAGTAVAPTRKGAITPEQANREPGSDDAGPGDWLLSREKVLWEWPYHADWLEESLG